MYGETFYGRHTAQHQILLVTCEHICYIQNHAQPSLFCETENLVRFHG